MGYRNIYLQNPAKLSVKNQQLIIQTDKIHSIPLEDINCVVIDNLQISLTGYLINKFSENAITVYVSNENHLPSTTLLPVNSHCRHLQMLKTQIAMTEPERKQLWKGIVYKKIENQAGVLQITGRDSWKSVDALKKKIKSGDSQNMEAVAAAMYFKILYGADFTRTSDSVANAFLNYGYTILRSTIAKNLVAYGFEPSLGIFHHSTLNKFNLADDIIEPYRPIVDLYVANNVKEFITRLDVQHKGELVNLLAMDVIIDEKRYSVSSAIEKTVQSLSTCVKAKTNCLLLPTIIPLEIHKYD